MRLCEGYGYEMYLVKTTLMRNEDRRRGVWAVDGMD